MDRIVLRLGKSLGVLSDKETEHIILCNGMVMKIHPALYGVLLHLRKYRTDGEYWIDRICINQGLNAEKSAQVQMMGEIYAGAEMTLAWLGPVPTFLTRGFENMNRVIANYKSRNPEAPWLVLTDPKDNQIASSKTEGSLVLGALLHIASRGYFGRIWVLQELALAPKVVFHLGKYQFQPGDISELLEVIDWPRAKATVDVDMSCEQKISSEIETGIAAAASMISRLCIPNWIKQVKTLPTFRVKEANNAEDGKWSLHEWLEACIHRHARDNKDLVFAGLSLIRNDLLEIRQDLLLDDPTPPPLPPRRDSLQVHNTLLEEQIPPPLPPRPEALQFQRDPNLPVISSPQSLPQIALLGIHPEANFERPRTGMIDCVGPEETSIGGSSKNVRLWPALHAAYDASEQEVLLNLAACVLSGPDGLKLLSFSSMLRDQSIEWEPSGTPSWVPTVNTKPPLLMEEELNDNLGGDFSAVSSLQNDPKISHDGRSLNLDGCKIGKVQELFDPFFLECDTLAKVESAIEILRVLIHHCPKAKSVMVAFTNSSTYGACRHSLKDIQGLTLGVCSAMDVCLKKSLDWIDKKLSDSGEQSLSLNEKLHSLPQSDTSKEAPNGTGDSQQRVAEFTHKATELRQTLLSTYMDFREAYPEAPWPELELNTPQRDPEEETEVTIAQVQVTKWSVSYLVCHEMFITDTGYIGATASCQIAHDDEVMLIKGAHIPYAFRRVDDAIAIRIQEIEMIDMEKEPAKSNEEIQRLMGEMGKKDGWVLVGEVYVDGVMDGEAVDEYADRFERLTIF
ncbi:hypothetical protein PFICI_00283 [Pestalotiopsis fici W106-1]|uniref:Heterokaryon incompatibility domain-containing protein n=1 Tax=Pestalotiopsis fici (strain W106-1 / CGMCC3.15140) TaxID=1229662 RepID=W3XKC9_PESFW|nr:uncharacterized protein PFICI_00283 [Pestalotiopsis fici W106-1]ETS86455.1 hypothetical protein PFICI_00283 [Pestalotiopsis fici W106-1]